MARVAGGLLLVAAGAGSSYYLVPFDHPFRRNARTATAVSLIGLDYKILKWRDRMEDPVVMDAAHARNAGRLFRLCADQGGVFTKFGQHVSTVGRTIPPAYKVALSRLKDQANYDEWSEIEETFQRELRRPVSDIFSRFDHVPVASASLAQVGSQGGEVRVSGISRGLQLTARAPGSWTGTPGDPAGLRH